MGKKFVVALLITILFLTSLDSSALAAETDGYANQQEEVIKNDNLMDLPISEEGLSDSVDYISDVDDIGKSDDAIDEDIAEDSISIEQAEFDDEVSVDENIDADDIPPLNNEATDIMVDNQDSVVPVGNGISSEYIYFGHTSIGFRTSDENAKTELNGKEAGVYRVDDRYYRVDSAGSVYICTPLRWKVIKDEGDSLLLLQDSVLESYNWDSSMDGATLTWENSQIRKYLNSVNFLNKYFTVEEQDDIQISVVSNTAVNDNSTAIGNTNDKVFLPSVNEISSIFSSDEERKAHFFDFSIPDITRPIGGFGNGDKYAYNIDEYTCAYWTRNPSNLNYGFLRPSLVTSEGNVAIYYNVYSTWDMGIRPLIRISKNSNDYCYAPIDIGLTTENRFVEIYPQKQYEIPVLKLTIDDIPKRFEPYLNGIIEKDLSLVNFKHSLNDNLVLDVSVGSYVITYTIYGVEPKEIVVKQYINVKPLKEQVSVAWNAEKKALEISWQNDSPAPGYEICRSESKDGVYEVIYSGNASSLKKDDSNYSYEDPDIDAEKIKTYWYKVRGLFEFDRKYIPSHNESESEYSEPVQLQEDKNYEFVKKLTGYSLRNANDKSRESIQNAIYDILFKAYFAPTDITIVEYKDTIKLFGTKEHIKNWPLKNSNKVPGNSVKDQYLSPNSIVFDHPSRGCMAYACFCSQYILGSAGQKNKSELTGITVDKIKNHVHQYADPGEQISWWGSNSHSIVFLGESSDENGFYYLSYSEGGSKIYLEYKTYQAILTWITGENYKSNNFIIWNTNEGSFHNKTAKSEKEMKERDSSITRERREFQCPIEAVISLNGEILDSRKDKNSASFGTLSREGDGFVFDLKYNELYELNIYGTGIGKMSAVIEYLDDEGNILDRRVIQYIPITDKTVVTSYYANIRGMYTLFVDDGSGNPTAWGAGTNETVTKPDNGLLGLENLNDIDLDESEDTPWGDILPEDQPASADSIPDGLWIAGINDYTYTGNAIKPAIRVYFKKKRLYAGKDYSISYKNNVKAGSENSGKKSPMVLIKGKGNYTGTATQKFTIKKAELTPSNLIAASSYTTGQKYSPVVKMGSNTLKVKKDYTIKYLDENKKALKKQPTKEGHYYFMIKGVGSCSGTFEVEYSISSNGSGISISKGIATVENITYGFKAEPAVSLDVSGKTLTRDKEYTVEFVGTSSAGKATAVFTGIGEYTGILRKSFNVTAASLSTATITVASSAAYQKGGAKPSVRVMLNDKKLVNGVDYSVSYINNTSVTTASVIVNGKGNYTDSTSKDYQITASQLDDSKMKIVIPDVKKGKTPAISIYDTNGKKLTVKKDYQVKIDKKNHTVMITAGTNGLYVGTIEKTYTELPDNKIISSVKLDKKALPKKYNEYTGKEIVLDNQWLIVKAGKKVLPKDSYTVTCVNNVKTGTATAIIQGINDYSGTIMFNYKIKSYKWSKILNWLISH